MKKLVFISLVLFSANCIAQNCKYSQNGVDKFTGKLTKVTKDFKFIETFASEGFLSIQKADTSLSLTLTYRTSFSSKIKVNDGAELSFLLEDGSIITIKKAGLINALMLFSRSFSNLKSYSCKSFIILI